MTQQDPPAAPAPDPPATPTVEERLAALEAKGAAPTDPPADGDDDGDDDSILDDLIESIEEVPHLIFRRIGDLFGR